MPRIAACLVVALALTSAAMAQPQLDLPRPSPKATVSQVVGLTDVSVAYSRPSVRGRTIWGDLVPYDQVWRTGANEATTITFSGPVTVQGTELAAGTYGLFTIPGREEWTVIFNKGAKLWGAYEYKPEEDVARVKVRPQSADHTEVMTFAFPVVTPEHAELALAWEKLELRIPIEVKTVAAVLTNARQAVAQAAADDWRTPLRAGAFALENNVAMDEAAAWIEKSIGVKKGFYNLSAKARLLKAQGKTAEAIEVAREAVALGKAAQPPNDTAPTERLIAEWSR